MAGTATTTSIQAAFTARAAVRGFSLVANATRSVHLLPGSSPLSATAGLVATK